MYPYFIADHLTPKTPTNAGLGFYTGSHVRRCGLSPRRDFVGLSFFAATHISTEYKFSNVSRRINDGLSSIFEQVA